MRAPVFRNARGFFLPSLAGRVKALSELHGQFIKVYRPGANDDPRPYSELLERLGNGEQLPDLLWLARHGCAAEAELNEATALVNAYQDSPGRAEMLTALMRLRSMRRGAVLHPDGKEVAGIPCVVRACPHTGSAIEYFTWLRAKLAIRSRRYRRAASACFSETPHTTTGRRRRRAAGSRGFPSSDSTPAPRPISRSPAQTG